MHGNLSLVPLKSPPQTLTVIFISLFEATGLNVIPEPLTVAQFSGATISHSKPPNSVNSVPLFLIVSQSLTSYLTSANISPEKFPFFLISIGLFASSLISAIVPFALL